MAKLLTIGEIMLEFSQFSSVDYKKSFAGDTFNVAHYAAKIGGDTIKADFLTALGDDSNSQQCIDFITDMSVNPHKIIKDKRYNIGLFTLSNDHKGEKQYGYWRGQSAARHLFDNQQDLSGYDLVYFSGISAAITLAKHNLIASLKHAMLSDSNTKSCKFIYDFNHRAQLWTFADAVAFASDILPLMDIVKISDEEMHLLYPDLDIAELSKQYPNSEWILTCGGEKAETWRHGQLLERLNFQEIDKIVDSSAAGDSFLAAYLVAKTQNKSVKQCLERGHYIASQVIQVKGSIVPITP